MICILTNGSKWFIIAALIINRIWAGVLLQALPEYLLLTKGEIMSDSKAIIEEKLAALESGLFTMSKDRARALSNHETVDLIEALRADVATIKAELNK